MSENLKNAVVMVGDDKVPHLDLGADEWIYPVNAEQDGQLWTLLFHMKPYRFHDLKQILPEIGSRIKVVSQQERRVFDGNTAACIPFFKEHFLCLSGITDGDGNEVSLEQQIAFLDANPNLMIKAVMEGMGGIMKDRPEEAAVGSKLVIGNFSNNVVKNKIRLFSPEAGRIVEVKYQLILAKESEDDRLRYRKANCQVLDSGKSEVSYSSNYDVLDNLVDRLVLTTRGILFNGVPATEANREEWKKKLPGWIKIVTIDQAFSENRIKNA